MSGFSELAANYQLHGQTPPAWAVQRKRGWQDDIGALIKELAPAITDLFERKRQDKIAEALMTGTAPRATAVTDASGHAISGGGPMDAAGVDQYNAGLGAATSTDVFQGSPAERLQLAQIIQKQRAAQEKARQETLMEGLRATKLQQQVTGTGPKGELGIYVDTPYGKMTAHQWSNDPRNPEGIKPADKPDTMGRIDKELKAESGAGVGDWSSAADKVTKDGNYMAMGGTPDAPKVVGSLPKERAQYYLDRIAAARGQQPDNIKPVTSVPGVSAEPPLPVPEPAINKDKTRDVVTRITKDGRKALFDANTKEFIQYAP